MQNNRNLLRRCLQHYKCENDDNANDVKSMIRENYTPRTRDATTFVSLLRLAGRGRDNRLFKVKIVRLQHIRHSTTLLTRRSYGEFARRFLSLCRINCLD